MGGRRIPPAARAAQVTSIRWHTELGYTAREIAAILGVPTPRVEYLRTREGIKSGATKWNTRERERLKARGQRSFDLEDTEEL